MVLEVGTTWTVDTPTGWSGVARWCMQRFWWFAVTLILVGAGSAVAAASNDIRVKDPEGKTVAVVVLCNECRSGGEHAGKPCNTGAEDGWQGDQPCGRCLVAANSDALLRYPYDLH